MELKTQDVKDMWAMVANWDDLLDRHAQEAFQIRKDISRVRAYLKTKIAEHDKAKAE